MKKLIQVNNLSVETKEKQILHNISFDIYAGEIVCLLGQSGSGKTMTALSILNILPNNISQTTGVILYEDKPFDNSIYGSFISTIMQQPASCFNPVFTIGTHFKDIMEANNMQYSKDIAIEILENITLTNAEEILLSYPHQLSGGMLQKIMIAIAISLRSKVIIADEPTSDLDVIGQKEILDLIYNLKTKDRSIFMITHNLSVVKYMADRVLIMQAGSIVDEFLADDLYEKNRHSYTKELIETNNSLYQNDWNINFGELYVEM